jgi:hypothetical protein
MNAKGTVSPRAFVMSLGWPLFLCVTVSAVKRNIDL